MGHKMRMMMACSTYIDKAVQAVTEEPSVHTMKAEREKRGQPGSPLVHEHSNGLDAPSPEAAYAGMSQARTTVDGLHPLLHASRQYAHIQPGRRLHCASSSFTLFLCDHLDERRLGDEYTCCEDHHHRLARQQTSKEESEEAASRLILAYKDVQQRPSGATDSQQYMSWNLVLHDCHHERHEASHQQYN